MTAEANMARNSTSLWHLSLLVLTILGVAFAVPREKPAWVFAAGFGSVLAVAAWYLAGLLNATATRWSPVVAGLCAGVGIWSAVLISITQHYRRERPKHALVEQLLQQWPNDAAEHVIGPDSAGWQGFVVHALRRRYGDFDPARQRWLWLFLAEGGAGIAVAAAVFDVALLLRPLTPRTEEPPA